MITIKDLNTDTTINFEITKFPDGTSQLWKLSPTPEMMGKIEVIWMFENEAELFHILQLGDLLSLKYRTFPVLNCPWLPFARQDKPYGNNSTFAKRTFLEAVRNSGYSGIKTYDAHSQSDFVTSIYPSVFHKFVKESSNYDIVVFPDMGAKARYGHLNESTLYCDKVRNQLTGEIEGLKLIAFDDEIEGKDVVIIDDICDGGRTFIETVKALIPFKPANIDLCVSHGIFSKGLDVLFDAGIRDIYTTNSRMNIVHTGNLEASGHKLIVYDIVDINSNIDYNDLKRQERKTL